MRNVPLVGTAATEMFAETVFRVPVRTFGGFADAVETEDFHFWGVRKFECNGCRTIYL